ncbi:hypothetical protein SIN8267_00880 [Sinobacterium norvegicum]|uniref:SRPBCC family protein n=1 Tax=Sinobacterium norvegicum TaxID=1641715 RepID=A0ABN8EEV7_9GAMM|nr:SRPBCC family protein [Sinobacterium norvegicum]CAH0990781.1 hypothetical protein SIN8267_00880 [Sinobacterium norvegicum]
MKKIVKALVLSLIVLISVLVVAANTGEAKQHLITTTVVVEQPIAEVWQQLQDFTVAHNYVPNIVDTQVVSEQLTGLGASRQVYNSDGSYIVETIIEWQPEQGFLLALEEQGGPVKPFVFSQFRYALEGISSDQTWVSFTLYYQLPWGNLGEWLNRYLLVEYLQRSQPAIAAGFKYFYEQKQPATDEDRSAYQRFTDVTQVE